jgi:hypothetical protein
MVIFISKIWENANCGNSLQLMALNNIIGNETPYLPKQGMNVFHKPP